MHNHNHSHPGCVEHCPAGGVHCKHTCPDCGQRYCCRCGKNFYNNGVGYPQILWGNIGDSQQWGTISNKSYDGLGLPTFCSSHSHS